METSIFLAKLLGVPLLFVGFGMIVNQDDIKEVLSEVAKSKVFVFFSGYMALLTGVAIVLFHNIWEASWVVLLTLFGWAAILKGIVRLLAPSYSEKTIASVAKNDIWINAITFAAFFLGAVLVYFGFAS